MLVCTLGDLLLDVIVRLDSRLAPGDDAVARTTLAPGGQAANVAAWAAALGASARIVAVQADDDAGTIVRRELESRRVDLRGPRGERTGPKARTSVHAATSTDTRAPRSRASRAASSAAAASGSRRSA